MYYRVLRFACCACAIILGLWWLGTAHLFAQQPGAPSAATGDIPQLYSQGMAAFQAGDYAKAAANLDAMLTKAEFHPQLEPAFFTVGSAYFNVPDYNKAIAAFKTYLTKFPHGPHAAEVSFAVGQAYLLSKDYPAAVGQFASLEKDPKYQEQALLFGGMASKEAGKADQAIATLEKLSGGELRTPLAVRGATLLAELYSQKGNSAKTIAIMRKLHQKIALVDDIVELNAMTVKLGDQLLEKRAFADALECYRAAYPQEQIVRLQSERINAMQKRIEENVAAGRLDPSQFGQIAAYNNQIKADIARIQQALDQFQKLPSITPAIYVRLARCFYETDQKWESVLVYQEIVDRYPKAAEREPAMFGLIVSLADVNQPKKAEARCDTYLKEFKDGPNAGTVGYMMGAVALQANDPRTAEKHFADILETQPQSPYRDQITYLIGNAKFMAGTYDDALAQYQKYLKEFPKGQSVEDVYFRLGLTAVFAGKYQDAINSLKEYLQKYPKGEYVADTKYRLAVCSYAAAQYDDVVKACQDWQAEFPKHPQSGEVLALQADAYGASDREKEAIETYIQSYKAATTDEVMNYSLFAASKLLQKRGEWDKVATLFNEFIEEKPDSATLISALYWVGKAKAHEGKNEEAKQITADTIKKYIGESRREGVELLLTQLAQLCVKKKKAEEPPSASPAVVADAIPAPASTSTSALAAAPIAQADPGAELDRLLGSALQDQNTTAKARVLYAKAELARLRRQPAEEEKNIASIAEFDSEDLSPVLLGRAGDYMLSKDKTEQATAFYQKLLDEYPKSDSADFAYHGLGEIALRKNDFPVALRYFTDGTEKIVASQKLKELTIGRGKALLALNRLDEAKRVFEQVASVREWRGESTAFSIFSLGDIEAKQGHWAEANAYFQRVYVGYQKFLPWVAKAYVRSGESFEKLGKAKEAANTYREMLRNEKLATFNEAQEARKRLDALGQQG